MPRKLGHPATIGGNSSHQGVEGLIVLTQHVPTCQLHPVARAGATRSLQNTIHFASLQNTLLEHTHHGTGKGWDWGGVGQ